MTCRAGGLIRKTLRKIWTGCETWGGDGTEINSAPAEPANDERACPKPKQRERGWLRHSQDSAPDFSAWERGVVDIKLPKAGIKIGNLLRCRGVASWIGYQIERTAIGPRQASF